MRACLPPRATAKATSFCKGILSVAWFTPIDERLSFSEVIQPLHRLPSISFASHKASWFSQRVFAQNQHSIVFNNSGSTSVTISTVYNTFNSFSRKEKLNDTNKQRMAQQSRPAGL